MVYSWNTEQLFLSYPGRRYSPRFPTSDALHRWALGFKQFSFHHLTITISTCGILLTTRGSSQPAFLRCCVLRPVSRPHNSGVLQGIPVASLYPLRGRFIAPLHGALYEVGSQRVIIADTFPTAPSRTGRTPFSVSGSPLACGLASLASYLLPSRHLGSTMAFRFSHPCFSG